MNTALFNAIWGLSHKSGLLDAVGVLFAQYLPYLMVIGAVFFLLSIAGQRNKILFFLEAALAIIISRGIIAEFIYFFYHHSRPFAVLGFDPLVSASGWSFPSGHATVYFALAMVLFFFDKTWGSWYLLFAAVNAIARVYAGVHWPADILGGAIIGILSALAVQFFLATYRKNLEKIPERNGSNA